MYVCLMNDALKKQMFYEKSIIHNLCKLLSENLDRYVKRYYFVREANSIAISGIHNIAFRSYDNHRWLHVDTVL